MTLDLAADSATFVADFGLTVRFRADGNASPRSIKANVIRGGVEDDGEAPFAGRRAPRVRLVVRNHATLGVLASEVQEDLSEFEVAYPEGADARWRRVVRIAKHNEGVLLIEVES